MVDDEAVVCMHDLAVNEVMDNAAVVDTMAISKVVDAVAVDEGDDDDGVDDAMGVDGVVDDGEVVDEAVDDAMEVDEVVNYAKVVDEVVDDATRVDGAVDDGEVVDEAVDDAMVVYDVVDDVMVAYDEEVVDEKLQLNVDTAVELHFHVLLLGIQSTENKRKCQKNVPGHCKFPHGTNRPIIKLNCTQGLSSFFHTSVYCKIPTKKYIKQMVPWLRSQRVRLTIQRSWVLVPLRALATCWICSQLSRVQILGHTCNKQTGCLLPACRRLLFPLLHAEKGRL